MFTSIESGFLVRHLRLALPWVACAISVFAAAPVVAQSTALADQPVLSNPLVPGNLAMPLSVEFPTAVSVAHLGDYDKTHSRLGYFDSDKCYSYLHVAAENAATGELSHFYPNGRATNYSCRGASGRWSGNFLNWATMQTIDPFRWALTGGNRAADTAPPNTTEAITILEKAYASGQGGEGNFPNRTTNSTNLVQDSTPFSWDRFRMRVQGLGIYMRFTRDGNVNNAPTVYQEGLTSTDTVYQVAVRVRVCTAAPSAGGESNCRLYGNHYKPEGLIQQYSDRIRYSAFGYLNIPEANGVNYARDGGVMRAKQKFVGPRTPRPGQSSIENNRREWDAATGVFRLNPDAEDATATNNQFGTSVTNSGVINYLNKFGQAGSYKTYDPVSELYYAALRYFMNLGNVTEWSAMGDAGSNAIRNNWTDGFPVITAWDDPIQYSCQSNFILGIGDVNTHADKNVSGNTKTDGETTKPSGVPNSADALINARALANTIGALESREAIGEYSGVYGGSNNSFMISGLAYGAHVLDIRPDSAAVPQTRGRQSVTTYWLDVLEYQQYRRFNQYWYATKYGGFDVPANYNSAGNTVATTNFPGQAAWTNGDTVGGNLRDDYIADIRPRNYFVASDPASMVSGLTAAFNGIASQLRAATTSFAVPSAQVTPSGNVSYSASYTSSNWTGALMASELGFATNGAATQKPVWAVGTPPAGLTDRLGTQLAGTKWNSDRYVITYRPDVGGVPFRATGTNNADRISATQLDRLDTPYGADVDGAQYLNYLRGERCNEVGATVAAYPTCTTTPLGYRPRANLLGDIAGSKVTAVAAPDSGYSDAVNPGYSAFVTSQSTRSRMAYVGANDGMLHAFNGELSNAGGTEVFAYVPSALFAGPSNCTTPATCAVDALVSRGDPTFEHRALVDGTPEVFDIDFARTGGPMRGSPKPEWRSVLIGGLGKGGRSYYAINVTDPDTPKSEAAWASRVLWEFPNASIPNQVAAAGQMGFSYGRPVVTKTVKHGWVVIFSSGYNSPTGGTTRSYLFFVNPKTGALLDTVTVGSEAQPSNGLAHVTPYRRDFADNTAESLYAGDLLGNVWRVDLRGTGTYSTPVNIARLANADGTRQPVTTRLQVEVDPRSGRRYVLIGTGSLLDSSDLGSTTTQSFYAIIDGTEGAFASSLPENFNFPITRNDLVRNDSRTLTGAGITATAMAPFGWYIDLGVNPTSGKAWRVVLDPISIAGRLSFGALLPDGGACSSDSSSRTYEVDFATGRSLLLQNTDGYTSLAGIIIDLRYLCVGITCRAQAGLQGNGDGASTLPAPPETPPFPLPGLRKLNWRELQIVQ